MNLYIPITNRHRELDSKLLLALHAKKCGFTPIIGYKSSIIFESPRLPCGIYLAHNARRAVDEFKKLVKFGHTVVVLDEEALVRQSDEIFLKKHKAGAFENIETVFCWGESDYNMWKGSNAFGALNLSITGNPRVDLLGKNYRRIFSRDADMIREKYGEFILVNTNFPTVNNIVRTAEGLHLVEKDQSLEDSFLSYKREIFLSFREMIKQVANAFPSKTIILRPHPNENQQFWSEYAKELKNVQVVYEGNVIPWLIACKMLIHNGCTTGIEASLLDKNVITFLPNTSGFNDTPANKPGAVCRTADEVVAKVGELENVSPGSAADTLLKEHIANVDQGSCGAIVSELAKIKGNARGVFETAKCKQVYIKRVLRLWAKLLASILTIEGRARLRLLISSAGPRSLFLLDHKILGYNREKIHLFVRTYGDIKISELDSKIEMFAKVNNEFSGYRIARHGRRLLQVIAD